VVEQKYERPRPCGKAKMLIQSEVMIIRVSMEVISGGASVSVGVWCESIERAVHLAGGRYPGCEARVPFR
jgi:hypothetical protein